MTGAAAPELRILHVVVERRRWKLRIPFHYGVATLTDALELHVRCEVELAGRDRGSGFAAELAAPKWFNKSATLTAAETVDRLELGVARLAVLAPREAGRAETIAALTTQLADTACSDSALRLAGLNALELSFAVGLIERAAIDALCRLRGLCFADLLESDGFGLAGHWRHQQQFGIERWVASLKPAPRIAIRHTIGLTDALTRSEATAPPDRRPVALEDVIATDGVSRFKVKLGGQLDEIERLRTLAAMLDKLCPEYLVTLDANESFTDADSFTAMLDVLATMPDLATFWSRIRLVEQPFDRENALTRSVAGAALGKPLIIDESDATDDAFERAVACGYAGVSIKTCKGVMRSLLNAAFAAMMAERGRACFVSAEDLCVQPGVALAQNLALFGVLGLPEAERNGHHYGPGACSLPAAERRSFQTQHPDLYGADGLRIENGALSASSSLAAIGFGTGVTPERSAHR